MTLIEIIDAFGRHVEKLDAKKWTRAQRIIKPLDTAFRTQASLSKPNYTTIHQKIDQAETQLVAQNPIYEVAIEELRQSLQTDYYCSLPEMWIQYKDGTAWKDIQLCEYLGEEVNAGDIDATLLKYMNLTEKIYNRIQYAGDAAYVERGADATEKVNIYKRFLISEFSKDFVADVKPVKKIVWNNFYEMDGEVNGHFCKTVRHYYTDLPNWKQWLTLKGALIQLIGGGSCGEMGFSAFFMMMYDSQKFKNPDGTHHIYFINGPTHSFVMALRPNDFNNKIRSRRYYWDGGTDRWVPFDEESYAGFSYQRYPHGWVIDPWFFNKSNHMMRWTKEANDLSLGYPDEKAIKISSFVVGPYKSAGKLKPLISYMDLNFIKDKFNDLSNNKKIRMAKKYVEMTDEIKEQEKKVDFLKKHKRFVKKFGNEDTDLKGPVHRLWRLYKKQMDAKMDGLNNKQKMDILIGVIESRFKSFLAGIHTSYIAGKDCDGLCNHFQNSQFAGREGVEKAMQSVYEYLVNTYTGENGKNQFIDKFKLDIMDIVKKEKLAQTAYHALMKGTV